MATKTIDISYWQGKVSISDFKKVKADGIVGIVQRSGYTGQSSFSLNSDSTMANNILNASKAGLSVGIYHYSQAISVSEARREAEYCLKLIKDYKTYITLPVFFDWEWGGRLSAKKANSLGKQKCTDICNAFCKVIADAGYKAGVYASLNVFQGYLYPAQIDNKYLIWVAQYNSKCSYDRKKYMWQYTSSGKVNGINGRVDMNYLYGDTPTPPSPTAKPYTGTFPKLPTRKYFKRGDKGAQVKYLQKFLNWYGEYKLVVDGVIGSKTIIAVEKFQKAEGLDVDGLFGKRCLAKAKVVKK